MKKRIYSNLLSGYFTYDSPERSIGIDLSSRKKFPIFPTKGLGVLYLENNSQKNLRILERYRQVI